MGRLLSWALAVLTASVIFVWLLDVAGHGLPQLVHRSLVVVWFLALIAVLARWLEGSWHRDRWTGLLLPGLLLLSLIVRLVGIGWEAGAGYYRDEGIYRAAAQLINTGKLLPESFIYGHFLYYLAALALWLQSLFTGLVAGMARLLFGATTETQVHFVVLRTTTAVLGALTTIPVFCIARRIAGTAAGVVAAFLIVFSPIYNEVTHLLISDVPAAFFASLCLLFVARLVDSERTSDYLWAGVCAGLAAGSKYPAGVVAVAIVVVWIRWRVAERRWSWSLLWAGLAAIGTVLAVMPGLLAYWGSAFGGEGKDLLFGLRQYGRGGWIGVIRQSNSIYYGQLVLESFKLPAVVLGLGGLVFLRREMLLRLLWNQAFPIAYLGLVISMNMAVKRNVLPVVPILAVLFAVGLMGWLRPLRSTASRRRVAAAWGLGALAVVLPIRATIEQEIAMVRIGTRALAVKWIRENIPRGAKLVKESYTPKLNPAEYAWLQGRFAARQELGVIRDPQHDFLLLAWNAYGRFTYPHNLTKPHHYVYAERYKEIFTWEKVQEFVPGATRRGPLMTLYRLHPETIDFRTQFDFRAQDAAFLSGPSPDSEESPRKLAFTRNGQWVLFKGYFEAGRYDVTVVANPAATSGRLRFVSRDNQPITEVELQAGVAVVEIPQRDKIFVYVELQPRSEFQSLRLAQ